MRLMIDTNIVLDVLLERMPFYPLSRKILALCDEGRIKGFISASTITDIFYLSRKALGSTAEAYRAMGSILKILKVLTVTNEDVTKAFIRQAKDFEDSLLATCAISNSCEAIVTRNGKDFADFGIDILTPEEAIDRLSRRSSLR